MEKAFDRVAPFYDRWIGRFMSGRMERMVSMLACSPDEVVLDLGGGTGLLSRRLVSRCKEVHLLDESPAMVRQVRHGKVRVQVGNATQTPYPDRFFDAIVLSDVLHHIREHNLLLDEVRRLLKPGGRLLVNEVDLERALGRAVASLEALFFVRVFPTSFRELGKKLESMGFRLMEEKRDAWSFIGLWRFAPQSAQGFVVTQAEFPQDFDGTHTQGN